MNTKTLATYIEKVVDEFEWNDFSPDEISSIKDKFIKIFAKNTPYWDKYKDTEKGFIIKFKTHGKNRKDTVLQFIFTSRDLTLTLKDPYPEEHTIEKAIQLEFYDIWIDHNLMNNAFIKLAGQGIKHSNELQKE